MITLAAPNGWRTMTSPVIVSLATQKMAGIPLTVAAFKRRRPDYQAYIRRAGAFITHPPKRKKEVP